MYGRYKDAFEKPNKILFTVFFDSANQEGVPGSTMANEKYLGSDENK